LRSIAQALQHQQSATLGSIGVAALAHPDLVIEIVALAAPPDQAADASSCIRHVRIAPESGRPRGRVFCRRSRHLRDCLKYLKSGGA
jgi:hypothetical protein